MTCQWLDLHKRRREPGERWRGKRKSTHEARMAQASSYDPRSRKVLACRAGRRGSFRQSVRYPATRRQMEWCYRQPAYYPTHCQAGYKPSPGSSYKPQPPPGFTKPCPEASASTLGYKPDMPPPQTCGMSSGHPAPTQHQQHHQQHHQHPPHHHQQQQQQHSSSRRRQGRASLPDPVFASSGRCPTTRTDIFPNTQR